MRRGATKVPKSNSMNEARMSEIPSQIDLKGASSFFTSRLDGRHVPRKHYVVVREIASMRDTSTAPPRPSHGARSEGRTAARGGHGCTWIAVLRHAGTLGACRETVLQLRRRAPRPEKLPSSE